ncbi:MAG: rRNA maturation RNase YbeY [Campylobacterales bacterium]|nr:rRNA maturation RNase YbeY [Campylobacterales bacterium]
MIDFENRTNAQIKQEIFEEIKCVVAGSKMFELIVVDDNEMQQINLEHRGLDKTTDVLSFPIKESKTHFIGSIIISIDTAERVAKEMGHTLDEELKILFIHGLLHLLGFDHETDNGQMRQEEAKIASKIGLKESLLSR